MSSYNPPPYMSACSQIVWKGEESPVLIRNYDYSPYMLEGVLLYSNWLRPVIASSDCMWGILDGMNDAGLCLSLTFGGRKIVGEGFGIPLIMRYVIETCKTTEEAIKKFKHIPSHMSYNITILDAQGHFETLFLSPDRPTILTSSPIGTNHQSQIEWEAYANLTGTREREKFLRHCVEIQEDSQESLIRKFLRPPLYNMQFERGFGTLYTAAYWAKTKEMRIFWQQKQVEQSFDNFKEIKAVINLSQGFFGKFV